MNSILKLKKKLENKEVFYGGIVTNVPRNKVSKFDPRTPEEIKTGGMTGGDRMSHHGYAKKYAQYLTPFLNKKNLVIAEVGILKGTGLAIWCDIFPKSRVLGFDIDLSHINNNWQNLNSLGAFLENKPELFEFDQLVNNEKFLEEILNENKINIVIDDGLHSDESILRTLESMLPHLIENFVYFIEDNAEIHKKIRKLFPDLSIDLEGELTILTRNQ